MNRFLFGDKTEEQDADRQRTTVELKKTHTEATKDSFTAYTEDGSRKERRCDPELKVFLEEYEKVCLICSSC